MEKSTEQRKNQQLQQLLEAERENAEGGGGGDDVTKVLQGRACNNTRGETFLYFEIS